MGKDAELMESVYRGVIFDMDGVLVDSERLYMRFWREACAEYGFTLTQEMALSLRSNSPETATPKFLKWFGETADYHRIRRQKQAGAGYLSGCRTDARSFPGGLHCR